MSTGSGTATAVMDVIEKEEMQELANARGASLQIISHPWTSPASSSLVDRIGRISLSNLSRKSLI